MNPYFAEMHAREKLKALRAEGVHNQAYQRSKIAPKRGARPLLLKWAAVLASLAGLLALLVR
jgi:hypothetical protein